MVRTPSRAGCRGHSSHGLTTSSHAPRRRAYPYGPLPPTAVSPLFEPPNQFVNERVPKGVTGSGQGLPERGHSRVAWANHGRDPLVDEHERVEGKAHAGFDRPSSADRTSGGGTCEPSGSARTYAPRRELGGA